ncbi:hypothetical protein PPYR_02305 [Photinus pyralis]|uniref:Uncharacterized protein n=1 Tax=Photinus pyralis TaxID=7054 RepID=A0A5N4B6V7_PHOPY|nr:uncharacterized protein LOC116165256 [Photinus pyralis]XP_031346795.1 uncharacterized protein LOC116173446 [Photinus pyralis]KAB0805335.1 hypothetical protein PPYR_02305 [Photinus pyralis]
MPKQKSTPDEWIRGFPELKIENGRIFCRACVKTIQNDKKYNVTQHVQTTLHVERRKKFEIEKSKQQTLVESVASSSRQDEQFKFNFDLCEMMIQANIPLKKLENGPFRQFLQTYCNRHIPAETTLRKNYVEPVFLQVYRKIQQLIGNNYIWFAVDETTDSCGRYVASLIVGVLNEDIATQGYVVSLKELPKTNSDTITRFVNESLTSLFLPNAVPTTKILLMISDAAAYMLKAGRNLKILYESLIHCTCVAHGVNRVAETVRLQFPEVNKLISNGKKIFVKAPLRVQQFKEKFPDLPLPPEPILTRWGTWLEAASYYSTYINQFEEVVTQFDAEATQSVKNCVNIFQNKKLRQDLAFLKGNYTFICTVIAKLEKQSVPLVESTGIIQDFKEQIQAVPGQLGRVVHGKLQDVFNKNSGFEVLLKVARVLQGEFVEDLDIDTTIVPKFKFAPITSVDVERSFSTLKNILSERRRNLTMQHLEQFAIIHCFKENE